MEIIVDTNRIIAALIKDGYSRRIILNEKFDLYTIEFGVKEVAKYKGMIKRKAHIDDAGFNSLMKSLMSKITVLDEDGISRKSVERAYKIMGEIDVDDSYFVALSIELGKKPIWSDDKHFFQQKKIKVLSTKELAGKL